MAAGDIYLGVSLTAGPDQRAIVDMLPGGQLIEVQSLEDRGNGIATDRDTWKITPAPRRTRFVTSERRYAGATAVGEAHDNATIGGTWRIQPAVGATDPVSDAMSRWSSFTAACDNAILGEAIAGSSVGRYIAWRPTGAERVTLAPLRGPGIWTPTYSANQFMQGQWIQMEAAFPVAPLMEYQPLDVFDDFSYDTGDYTFELGGLTATLGGGAVVPLTVQPKKLTHTGRGHLYGDVQATIKLTPGSSPGIADYGILLKFDDLSNYIICRLDATGPGLIISSVNSGTVTTLASVGGPTTSAGVPYWLRGRIEGNVVFVEFFTSKPTPTGTPAYSTFFTLTGSNATKFGSGTDGKVGFSWTPDSLTARLDDFEIKAFTYNNRTLPARIKLDGNIPGDAPAKADLYVTPSGGTDPPVFALAALVESSTSSTTPYGVIEAETGANLSGFTSGGVTGASSGFALRATPSGAGSASVSYTVDPSDISPEPYDGRQVFIEVWVRYFVLGASSLVSPRMGCSLTNVNGTTFGQERFSDGPFGAIGSPVVVPSSGDVFRVMRLGVLTATNEWASQQMLLKVFMTWAAGSTSPANGVGIDQLYLLPAKARICSPTRKALDSSYPRFVQSTAQTTRRISSDLRGWTQNPVATSGWYPDTPLSGAPLEPRPGNIDLIMKLSSLVPDDPSSTSLSEQLGHTTTVQVAVTPRALLAAT